MTWNLLLAQIGTKVEQPAPVATLRPSHTNCAVCGDKLAKGKYSHTAMYCSLLCKRAAQRDQYAKRKSTKEN